MTSDEELKKILENIEIPPEQALVYVKLLSAGEATRTELAHFTGIKRTTLYPLLEKMLHKGLVVQAADRKTFQPVHPHQLFEQFQNNNLIFYHALPQFLSRIQNPAPLTKMKLYRGVKGIQQLFLDELDEYKEKKEKLLRVVGSVSFHIEDPQFRRQYQMKRKELGVKTRLISHLDLKPLEDQYQGLNVEIRYFPLATETFGCHFSCTNERVTIIGFLQERNGVIIESRELADTFAKWFDYTWEMLKKNN